MGRGVRVAQDKQLQGFKCMTWWGDWLAGVGGGGALCSGFGWGEGNLRSFVWILVLWWGCMWGEEEEWD